MRGWRAHEVQRPPDHDLGGGVAAKYSTKHLLSSPVGPFGCWAKGPGFRKVVLLTLNKSAMIVSRFMGLRSHSGERGSPRAQDFTDGPSLRDAAPGMERRVSVEDFT